MLAKRSAAVKMCRSVNLMKWKCFVPGKKGTDWEGGFYPLTMEFTDDYPAKPPKVRHLCTLTTAANYSCAHAARVLVQPKRPQLRRSVHVSSLV